MTIINKIPLNATAGTEGKPEVPPNRRFKVNVGQRRNRYFNTIESARYYCNQVFARSNVVLSIVDTSEHRNEVLKAYTPPSDQPHKRQESAHTQETSIKWAQRCGELQGRIESLEGECDHLRDTAQRSCLSVNKLAKERDALLAVVQNFFEWNANHFGDFSDDINKQLLCLSNEAEAEIAAAEKGKKQYE